MISLAIVFIFFGSGTSYVSISTFAAPPYDQRAPAQPTAWAFEATFDGQPAAPSQALLPRDFDYVVTHRTHPQDHFSALGSFPADHDENCLAPDPAATPVPQHMVQSNNASRGDAPDASFYICHDHLMSALGDVAGYSVSAFWPRQEFDFASGGTLEFDVNINERGARSWWEILIAPRAQMKVGAAHAWLPIDETYPPDRMVFDFSQLQRRIEVGSGALDPAGKQVDQADWRSWAFLYPDDPALADRRIRRTMRITFATNKITWSVEKADGGFDNFAVDVPDGLPFTRGLVMFKTHAYTPQKDGNFDNYTFHWDNVRFSGPVVGRYEAREAAEAVYLQANGSRTIGESVTTTVTLPTVGVNPVLFGQLHSPLTGQVQLSINGQPDVVVHPYDYETDDCYATGWNSFRLPLDARTLQVGINTLRWTIGPRPACVPEEVWDGFSVKDLEIQFDLAGDPQSTPTVPPRATPTATATEGPAATATATQMPTITPTVPSPNGIGALDLLLPMVANRFGPPSVSFLSPASRAVVTETFLVRMVAENLTIEPAGDVRTGLGHFHIMIDEPCLPPGRPIPRNSKHIHLDQGEVITTLTLTPGTHTLCLQAGDGVHTALPGVDIITVTVVQSGLGGTFTTSVAPGGNDGFDAAEFSLWLPDGIPVLRGVIIDAPECGTGSVLSGAPVKNRRDFAARWQMGYLGFKFTDKRGKYCTWQDAAGSGSARAIFTALSNLHVETVRPELSQAPWVIFGWSGGAIWAMEMGIAHPQRTIAVFARGSTSDDGKTSDAYGVPMILSTGEFDFWKPGMINHFNEHRSAGAQWALAITPGEGHVLYKAWDMALPFFDAVNGQRLPSIPPPGDIITLRPADAAKTWLGNNETKEATAANGYTGDQSTASWLPDEATAKLWEEYVLTGFK